MNELGVSFLFVLQISTDVETGKTKISRINGSIHAIPGKEVGIVFITSQHLLEIGS